MRRSIVEGDDFSVLPPYAVRLARRLRSMVDRLVRKEGEPRPVQSNDEDGDGA